MFGVSHAVEVQVLVLAMFAGGSVRFHTAVEFLIQLAFYTHQTDMIPGVNISHQTASKK